MVISTCFLEKKYGIVILQSSAKFDTGLDRIIFFFFCQGKVNPSPATKRMHLKMSSAACKCLHQGL